MPTFFFCNKKSWTSTFLMYFGVLNLDSGNQIWKFKYRYFGKFSEFEFNKYHIFWTLDFYRIKIGLSLKSLGTTGLDTYTPLNIRSEAISWFVLHWFVFITKFAKISQKLGLILQMDGPKRYFGLKKFLRQNQSTK